MLGPDQAPLGLPIFVLRRVLIQQRVVQRLVALRLAVPRLTLALRIMMMLLEISSPYAHAGGI
jgi:hypothetical protein